MELEQVKKEKLQDYISGLRELKNSAFVPIGLVVIDDEDRDDILTIFKKESTIILSVEENHPDVILKDLIGAIKYNQIIVLDIKQKIPAKILNQLSNLGDNRIYVQLAGEIKSRFIDIENKASKIILLINEDYYINSALQDIHSSVCLLYK